MVEFKSHKPGTFCWVDLATSAPEEAKKFYNALFGWEAEDEPAGEGMVYTMLKIKGKPVAALYKMNPEMQKMNIPPHWTSYFTVENADETMEKATKAGGKPVMEVFDVGDNGRMALFSDSVGAHLAAWQPKESIGASYKYIPGAIAWAEHGSGDPEKAIPFYESVFGWSSKTQKYGEGDYTTFFLGEEMVAGMYKMPADMKGVPPHWLPYFSTADIAQNIETIEKNGGKIIMPKTNFEGVGDVVIFSDPQGAVSGIVQPA